MPGSSFGALTAPFYTYNHSAKVVANVDVPDRRSSIAGLAFMAAAPIPQQYHGALFFARLQLATASGRCFRTHRADPDPNNG